VRSQGLLVEPFLNRLQVVRGRRDEFQLVVQQRVVIGYTENGFGQHPGHRRRGEGLDPERHQAGRAAIERLLCGFHPLCHALGVGDHGVAGLFHV